MASYAPPTENLPIFNPGVWSNTLPGGGITQAVADGLYVSLATSQAVPSTKTYNTTQIFDDAAQFNTTSAIAGGEAQIIKSNTAPFVSRIYNVNPTTSTDIVIPQSSGTLALTSQIPTSSTFMDLTTNQSADGNKTFTGNVALNDPIVAAATYLGNSFSDALATVSDPVSNGTIGQLSFNYLGAKTVNATSATTYTNAATLHVTGPPILGTNVAMTNRNAIQVDSGNCRLTSGLYLSSGLGVAAGPVFSMGALLNDGIYSSGAGAVNVATGGTLRVSFGGTTTTSTVRFQGPIGTAAAVSFGCNSGSSGMFSPAASQIALSAGGTAILSSTAAQTAFPVAGTALLPSIYLSTDTTTGLYRAAANNLAVTVQAAQVASFTTAGLAVTGAVTATTRVGFGAGTAAAPSLYFTADTNTGFSRPGANQWNFSASSTPVLTFDSLGLTCAAKVLTTQLQVAANGTTFSQIRTGTDSILLNGSGPDFQSNTTITFSPAFSSAPTVLVSVNNNSGGIASSCTVQSRPSVAGSVVINAFYPRSGAINESIGFTWMAWN